MRAKTTRTGLQRADASAVEGIFGCRGGSLVVRTTANSNDTPGSWPGLAQRVRLATERCNYPKQVVGIR